MSELDTKYRAAPRQVSPARLDDLILLHAKQKVAGKSRPLLRVSSWKSLMASFCVVGLGVGLVLRYGLPPLSQPSGSSQHATQESPAVVGLTDSESDRPLEVNDPLNESLVIGEQASGSGVRKKLMRADLTSGDDLLNEESKVVVLDAVELEVKQRRRAASVLPLPLESAKPLANIPELSVLEPVGTTPGMKSATAPSPLSLGETRQVLDSAVQIGPDTQGIAVASADEDVVSAMASDATVANARSPVTVYKVVPESAGDDLAIGAKSSSLLVRKELSFNSRAKQKSSTSNSVSAERNNASADLDPDSTLVAVNQESLIIDATNWLLNQSSKEFTLQLATASDAQYLREFARSLNLTREWHVVELGSGVQGDSRNSFGLIYGVFETADQALTAASALDENASKFDPWLRSFNRLHQEVARR